MQSRVEVLQSKLNKEAGKLNLRCEISPENLKDIVIIKKDGQINLKEFAIIKNLDYFVSSDLINGLTDYFKDAQNEDSDGICCPISFDELDENQHPVILCPSEGHVAGTILSHSSAIKLPRKIDPKNNGIFEKIIDAPIVCFLVGHMRSIKMANEITIKEQEKTDCIHEKPNNELKSNVPFYYGFFAERNNSFPSNHNDQQNLVKSIRENVQNMLNKYAEHHDGYGTRAAMASELERKANNLNTENLSDFLSTVHSMREAISSEYRFGNASRSLFYRGIDNILEQHEANGHQMPISSAHAMY